MTNATIKTFNSQWDMTPREALRIQQEQISYYAERAMFKDVNLTGIMRSKTNISGINLDATMSISEINQRIPRGWAIERVLGLV